MTGPDPLRTCPVCRRYVDAHREPVADGRLEVVFYPQHLEGTDKPCGMSGQCAAVAAVGLTAEVAA